MQLLEGNRINLSGFVLGNCFLDRTTKAHATKENVDISNFIKIKKFGA